MQRSRSGTRATEGALSITQSQGGSHRYTLKCTGTGGDVTQSVILTVPLKVMGSSHDNKNRSGMTSTVLPGTADPSMEAVAKAFEASEMHLNGRSTAIADFLGEGSPSVFVASTRYVNAFPGNNPQKWPDAPGRVYLLKKSANGQWTDESARIFKTSADREACITSSYAIVADFNGDKRPDVYIACTGIDFTLNGAWTNDQKSHQLIWLSQTDGSYRRRVVSEAGEIYGHQATAADIDGDGKVDIVTVDVLINRQPFVLWGNGDGTFRKDLTRMPAETQGKNIYGALLIPTPSGLQLALSGFDSSAISGGCQGNCYGTKIHRFQGGKFVESADLTPKLPHSFTGLRFGLGLDHIWWNGFLYSFHVNEAYSEDIVVKTDLSTGAVTEVYRKRTQAFGDGLTLINITPDGYLENYGMVCNRYDATATAVCAVRIKL